MESGIFAGLICAAIVWALGFTLVRPNMTQGDILGLGRAIVFFIRSGLFIASSACLVVLFVAAISSGTFAFFNGFTSAYVLGVVAYFFVRYKPRIKFDFRDR